MTSPTKPILFSGPMVRAILDGRKTMTRRLMPHQESLKIAYSPIVSGPTIYNYAGEEVVSKAPYAPGDLLWVRETWARTENAAGQSPWPDRPHMVLKPDLVERAVIWAADGDWEWCDGDGWRSDRSFWKPSIHMPRWASRLTLEVTDVRVERLQDISEEDAKAEGQPASSANSPRVWFMTLWDSLNARRGFGWDVNPWVVAVTFKVHKANVDAFLEKQEAA